MNAPLKRQAEFPIEYVFQYAKLGSPVHMDYMSTPFDPPERGTWDDVKAITDVGWFCYSEEKVSADDHLDRTARAGFQFDRGFVTDDRTWSESLWVIQLYERMKK
jgi:hypothetical protein